MKRNLLIMMKAIRLPYFLSTVIAILLASCTTITTEPVVTTTNISNVTLTAATSGGTIVSDGGAAITAQGICWSTSADPTVKSYTTLDALGTASFIDSLINLTAGTTFYVRAYATNSNGTGYGKVLQVTTLSDTSLPNPLLNPNLSYDSITDIDGNKYHTITVGTQTWTVENLYVSKYRNGDVIPNETNNSNWKALTTGAQCTYNNNVEWNSIKKFGRLYNFYAVSDARNIAPNGWHVATDAEWSTLINYLANNLGISTSVAQAMAAKTDWTESSITSTIGCIDFTIYESVNNSSGLCALPAGIRGDYGEFNYVANYGGWWTSNQSDNENAWFRSLSYNGKNVGRNTYNKYYGLSVRCIKN
ncbi:MAG: fibrobacter succinogenes major paralogous domain-containing protein [Paludibacter sp.]